MTCQLQVSHDGLVRTCDLLKLFGRFLLKVRVLVRMMLQSQPGAMSAMAEYAKATECGVGSILIKRESLGETM